MKFLTKALPEQLHSNLQSAVVVRCIIMPGLKNVIMSFRGVLAIVAMRHVSQGHLQSYIQNVKKKGLLEEFWEPFEFFFNAVEAF
jgi:hypothetical protein